MMVIMMPPSSDCFIHPLLLLLLEFFELPGCKILLTPTTTITPRGRPSG
jgi:hypothetical protein